VNVLDAKFLTVTLDTNDVDPDVLLATLDTKARPVVFLTVVLDTTEDVEANNTVIRATRFFCIHRAMAYTLETKFRVPS